MGQARVYSLEDVFLLPRESSGPEERLSEWDTVKRAKSGGSLELTVDARLPSEAFRASCWGWREGPDHHAAVVQPGTQARYSTLVPPPVTI